MNKLYKLLIIALILIVGGNTLKAQTLNRELTTGSCGTNATYTLDDAGVLTISGTGDINASAFKQKSNITMVVIENGITGIGNDAFRLCTKLRYISIPQSVKKIGDYAFYQCADYGMKTCIVANDELSIGDKAFNQIYGKSYLSFAGKNAPTLGESVFDTKFTIHLPADYNDGVGVAPEFGNVTVKIIAETNAEASVTFSNNAVINFETLSDAFIGATCSYGSTIKLLKDVENVGGDLPGISEVAFDLNGKNITINKNYFIRINAGVKLTITGNGKITYNYEPTNAPGATSGYLRSLYAPVVVITNQNTAGIAELVIGGNVVIETTDDLTAAVSVSSNESTSLARLIVKDNAKFISNNPNYVICYESPSSGYRVGVSEVIVEGGIFENQAGGYAVGYYNDTYATPDQHYHAYIGAENATVDPKMTSVYYGLSYNLPPVAGTVTFSENGVLRNDKYYFADDETVSFTVSNIPEGVTFESVKLNDDTELIDNEGVYSFTMPAKPSKLVFAAGLSVNMHNITVNLDGGSLTEAGIAKLEEYQSQYGIEVDYDVAAGTLNADIPEGTEVEINIDKGEMYVTKENHTLIGFSDSDTDYLGNTTVTVTESKTYTLLWEEKLYTPWSFDNNTLTIYGIGAMNDFEGETPWNEYNNNIDVIVVEGGVTYIGNNAFSATSATEIFFYGTEPPVLGNNSIPETASIYVPTLEVWNEAAWNNVNYMPTWTSQQVNETMSQQVWVGLAEGQTEPGENDHVAINAPLLLSQQVNSLRVKSFGYCGDGTTTNGSITIEEGGQLYCETARGEVTVRKEILGYQQSGSGSESKWYTIASPLKDVTSTSSVSGLLTTESDFDLYRYDEPTHTWQNAKPGVGSTNFQTIESGRGYLYANAENTTLEFKGNINTEDVNYTLTAQSEVLNGFHLVGNPYTHDISFNHLSADAELANGYYVLNGEGAWGATLGNEGDVIKVGQGALIKTTNAGTLTISRDASTTRKNKQDVVDTSKKSTISLTVSNAKYSDRAFVVFDKGVGLDKINHENENIPLLYIPQDDTDYAIAMMDENVSEIPVSFEAMTMGQYTISLQQENCDFDELYLLDKETGEKVNILEEDYTFMATTADNAERFVLTMNSDNDTDSDNGNFAYISGEDLIISVEGAVQIIDVMGRIIYSNDVTSDNNRIDVSVFDNAAYIVRVVNENGVKVQKIIL
ncbi:MAG: leucine-rich repeat domain-containing protein [Bacteroidales bacterium]|nr:leucine-rich repeat domain-containing protein [Bacteroidales bacterium]